MLCQYLKKIIICRLCSKLSDILRFISLHSARQHNTEWNLEDVIKHLWTYTDPIQRKNDQNELQNKLPKKSEINENELSNDDRIFYSLIVLSE